MKQLALLSIISLLYLPVSAKDFFSTEKCENIIDISAQIGVNTSNRTIGNLTTNGAGINEYNGYNNEGWGTGFELGVATDLNIRDYLSIQPGLFFESRSSTYNLVSSFPVGNGAPENFFTFMQAGTLNSYHLTAAIMGRMHFNITDNLRWDLEAGPFASFRLGSKLKNKVCTAPLVDDILYTDHTSESIGPEFKQKCAHKEYGIKMGTGLTILNRYTCSVAYMAGLTHAWNDIVYQDTYKYTYGGRSKVWTFTIGYIF